jgi:phage/plasmid-like protein (TIGR03299 family)
MIAEQVKFENGNADIASVLDEGEANWIAEERPLFASGGIDADGTILDEVPIGTHKALVRSDNQKSIGIVGKNYHPVQNYTAFSFVDALVADEKATYENIWMINGGSRMYVQARVQDASFDIREGDELEGYITMINSFDGSTSFKVFFTSIRLFCMNQLNAALRNQMVNVSIRHSKSAEEKVEEALKVFDKGQMYFKMFQEQARALAQKQVDARMVERFLDGVLGLPESTVKKNQHEAVTELAENGMGNNGQTLWDWYNGVTEWVDHHAVKDEAKRTANALVGTGANRKQKAWDQAMYLLDA